MIESVNDFNLIEKEYNYALKAEICNKNTENYCPHCKSQLHIKYGKFNGIQRYKCKNCNRTFSGATNSISYYSKNNIKNWVIFYNCMLEKKTLRYCSHKLNISLSTAFFWRHKIMRGLRNLTIASKLEGKVFLKSAMIKDNYKGCRNIDALNLGRRGYIIIEAARGRGDNMIIEPISRLFYEFTYFKKRVYSKIDKNAYIVPDNPIRPREIIDKHNKGIVLNCRKEWRTDKFDFMFNQFIDSFKGVASKYLCEYINYYLIFILNKKFSINSYREILIQKSIKLDRKEEIINQYTYI